MNWRDVLLQTIDPDFASLLTIADPDGLFRDTEIQLAITHRGYIILPYDDPIAFRVAYEALYARADGMPPLMVIIWDRNRLLNTLPADLLSHSVQRHVSLAELFPRLHIPILSELDSVRLDRLWAVYGQQRGPLLSAAATAEAVLQTGYGISLTALQTPADALHVLLTIHFSAQPLPPFLANVILQQLTALPNLATWPLETMLHDRAAFDVFLSRAWPRFLHEHGYLIAPTSEHSGINEHTTPYHTAPLLPFDNPHIWPSIDTLFLSGRMQPHPIPAGWSVPEQYAIGVKQSNTMETPTKYARLIAQLQNQCPTPDAPAAAWLSLAPLIGELLRWDSTTAAHQTTTETLEMLQSHFTTWMQHRYAALRNTTPLPRPTLVSHLPHLMAHKRMLNQDRHALLVIDGLALDQWLVLRDTWEAQGYGFVWDERVLFAWVPTLTSISRQAIFAGSPPSHFAMSLDRTDREEAHWKRFWNDQGLQTQSIVYQKNLHGFEPQSGAAELAHIEDLLSDHRIQVIGLVVDAVDKIAHGMQQGAAGMIQQVQQWAENGWCAHLITRLCDAGFHVTLTSDHGNTPACGIGRIQDGILAEERGQRARIYANRTLREQVLINHPHLLPWDNAGLPTEIAAVLAPSGQAFGTDGQLIVSHGSIDMREVLVPWCVLQ